MAKTTTPLRAIRRHCIECMGGQVYEVKHCTSPECNLYPYRMGRNPKRKGIGGNIGKTRKKLNAKRETLTQ